MVQRSALTIIWRRFKETLLCCLSLCLIHLQRSEEPEEHMLRNRQAKKTLPVIFERRNVLYEAAVRTPGLCVGADLRRCVCGAEARSHSPH